LWILLLRQRSVLEVGKYRDEETHFVVVPALRPVAYTYDLFRSFV